MSERLVPYRSILFAVIGLFAAVYPFVVYYGLNHYSPSVFAWVLLLLLILRVAIKGNFNEPSQWLQLVVVGAFCIIVAIVNSESLLRYYPVLMSLGFAALFAFSLRSKTSLIERFAKMAGSEYPVIAQAYMRRLTAVWAVLLLLNAVVAAYSACCLSLQHWTFYNGLLAYVLIGGFSIAELIFRHFYKKKHLQQLDSIDGGE